MKVQKARIRLDIQVKQQRKRGIKCRKAAMARQVVEGQDGKSKGTD